jgi:hypothetical protein
MQGRRASIYTDRQRQLRAMRNHALREREKQSDQLRCYQLWLYDSEARSLMADVKAKPDDANTNITKRETRLLVGDLGTGIVRDKLNIRKSRNR